MVSASSVLIMKRTFILSSWVYIGTYQYGILRLALSQNENTKWIELCEVHCGVGLQPPSHLGMERFIFF